MQFIKQLSAIVFACSAATVASAQYTSSSIAYNFTDISTTGTPLGLAGVEDGGQSLPIGFGFTFYGSSISSIAATTNGYLTTGGDLTDFTPDCPAPNSIDPNGMIAPYFEDLSLVDHGEIYYQAFGTTPNQLTIVQWEDSSTFDSSIASLTFQVQLFESGRIQLHYESLADTSGVFPVGGDQAFVGVESPDGTSAESIACVPGAPVLTSNTAWEIAPVLPFIDAPEQVVSGTTFSIPGAADPTSFYVYAWSLSTGPLGPLPILGGLSLDLGLNFKLAGAGLTPASGQIASDNLLSPLGFNFTQVFWQCVTIGSFGPIANVKKSNSDSTILRDGKLFNGAILSAGAADHYTFPGNIGDVVLIRHCRTDNTGTGSGTLDPYVCLVDPSGLVVASDDDSAGACLVDGPFGASEIINHVLLANGTWTVVASSYQGIGDEVGTYELTLIAPGAQSASLAIDEGPVCPGQFQNPVVKFQGTQEIRRRRR